MYLDPQEYSYKLKKLEEEKLKLAQELTSDDVTCKKCGEKASETMCYFLVDEYDIGIRITYYHCPYCNHKFYIEEKAQCQLQT